MALTTNRGQELFSDHNPDQIQAAKDFIWEYIDEHNKKLIIHQMNKVLSNTNTLSIKKVTIGYQYH